MDSHHRRVTRALLEKYVNQNNIVVRHQIDSYDDFILHKLEQIITSFNPIEINEQYLPDRGQYKHRVMLCIENPTLARPMITEKDGQQKIMMPNDARLRNMTYASQLTVDVLVTTKVLNLDSGEYTEESRRLTCVNLGKIPVMVRSRYCNLRQNVVPSPYDECRFDYGGYFIINGNEKVVIAQDRIAENKVFVFVNNKPTPYSHVAEVRSVSERRFGIPKTTAVKLSTRGNQFGRYIRVNVHHMKHEIPLFVLFRALGVQCDQDIVRHIVADMSDPIINELTGSMDEASSVRTRANAMAYLARFIYVSSASSTATTTTTTTTSTTTKPSDLAQTTAAAPAPAPTHKPPSSHHVPRPAVNKMDVVMNLLEHELFPHIGTDLYLKAVFLGFMVRKLLRCCLGEWPLDDRDSYVNKRIDTPGILVANLFRQYFSKTVKDMRNLILKDVVNWPWRATNKLINVVTKNNVYKLIKPTIIESGLKYGLATGNWGVKSSRQRQGVAQVLNRMTYMSTLSHLRRINTPIEKTGKLVQPRKLHPTQWGVICPSECFDPQTPILMWDGTIRAAKEIVVGDHLIDDTGNAVKVKSTCAGIKTMYEVIPDQNNFMSYTVTDNHILTLMVDKHKKVRTHTHSGTMWWLSWFDKEDMRYRYKEFDDKEGLDRFSSMLDDDNVIDITIDQSLPKHVRENLYVFKSSGINWEHKAVALDPYVLGMWLGDGLSSGYGFITADEELHSKWTEWAAQNDGTITTSQSRYKYFISSTTDKTQPGPLKKLLSQYGLINNKHIPREYLVNDRMTRLAVLAGLVDTDGHVSANVIRMCQGAPNYQVLYDIEFLARSLGFSCHMNDGVCSDTVEGEKRRKPYKELSITGPNLYEIPTVLPRKKLHKFDSPGVSEKRCFLQSSFKLIKKDVQPFVGWQLEGNGGFLLGDMSVVHNTPEGASVGLVKNLAMTTTITNASSAVHLRQFLLDLGMGPFVAGCDITAFMQMTAVFVNGSILGVHADPPMLYHALKRAKRAGRIHVQTGVVWNIFHNIIAVCTEGGRCCRPLYILGGDSASTRVTPQLAERILAGGAEAPSWAQLEANYAMIAMGPLATGDSSWRRDVRYTHMELDPSLMLGAIAGTIPFSDHNQAPRNTYQSAMGKQAISVYASNFRHRFDTVGHILNYPQRPLVNTYISNLLHGNELPSGINAIVAIATYSGYNQEDSIIINRSAVGRGLFVSTIFKTYREQNNKNHSTGEEEFFCRPDRTTTALKPFNYDKLGADGFVPVNTYVDTGDVIIGKCMPQKFGNSIMNKDTSVVLKSNERGYVDRNCYNDNYFTNVNGDGYTFAKVRIRHERSPTIGDKFSSRHGQKGTMGMSFRAEDMPFTADGLVPDIIVNPHAIPSRMTIGQLLECILGTACVTYSAFGDATPFTGTTVEEVGNLLQRAGHARLGNHVLYNSRTGEQITTTIFMGPTYYQRLKHMVEDKIHSRSSNGPVVLLTRQPAEGRARDGGLRLGEMEIECQWSHGMLHFLKERFMECSDNYRVFTCRKCGMFAVCNPDKKIYSCRACKNITSFAEIRIPYACKLLLQEIQTMSIGARFLTD
ncbi:hypothetical protein HYH03_017287 [Edaphochlamys debaryana]|uniref:DNA-directed RNA polymerase subunit beta n=1 Tax=Edaphochlamys debaryana TaxID=47281 RepID=A0A835XJE2_9CHLO|nr:hypothetical protein HYH03_017287 [Edaphochlamys debaryana]|eukprot:KAG2483893.1 hypothetical protein HYH03_017287 [Edaphochlamys debaryana]